MKEWREELLDGGLRVVCSPEHRFGTDAFLLADFAVPRPGEVICDLGTGCGIIPFLWLRPPFPRGKSEDGRGRWPGRIYGVEIQEQGVRQFAQGVEANGVQETVFPVPADFTDREALKDFMKPGTLDMVSCNPPYKPARTGILSGEESHRPAKRPGWPPSGCALWPSGWGRSPGSFSWRAKRAQSQGCGCCRSCSLSRSCRRGAPPFPRKCCASTTRRPRCPGGRAGKKNVNRQNTQGYGVENCISR